MASSFIRTIIAIVAAMFFITGCNNRAELPTAPRLGYKDKSPVGGSVLHSVVHEYYSVLNYNSNSIEQWSDYQLPYDTLPGDNLYIAAAPTINMLDAEADKILALVHSGSSAILMADRFSENLLERIGVVHNDPVSDFSNYDYPHRDLNNVSQSVIVEFPDSLAYYPAYFNELSRAFNFKKSDSTNIVPIGWNNKNKIDILKVRHGDGTLILMTNVSAVTNYYLLTNNNYELVIKLLNHLPVGEQVYIYWDNFFYNNSNRDRDNDSPDFSVILNNIYARWAVIIALLAMILWILNNVFRKQRIIPVLQKNENTSMAFTNAIAQLYYNKKDNASIALKMSAWLQDYMHQNYFFKFEGYNEAFTQIIHHKAGLDLDKSVHLTNILLRVSNNKGISDNDLLTLNEYLQEIIK